MVCGRGRVFAGSLGWWEYPETTGYNIQNYLLVHAAWLNEKRCVVYSVHLWGLCVTQHDSNKPKIKTLIRNSVVLCNSTFHRHKKSHGDDESILEVGHRAQCEHRPVGSREGHSHALLWYEATGPSVIVPLVLSCLWLALLLSIQHVLNATLCTYCTVMSPTVHAQFKSFIIIHVLTRNAKSKYSWTGLYSDCR